MKKKLTFLLFYFLVFIFLLSNFSLFKKSKRSDAFIPLIKEVNLINPSLPYSRKHWAVWSDLDSDCQNQRTEALLIYNLADINLEKKLCSIKSGLWIMPYSKENELIRKSSSIDVDHIIPLAYAARLNLNSYAKNSEKFFWSFKTRRLFGNDIDNIIPTSRYQNRLKGHKSIVHWLPDNEILIPFYLKKWKFIKEKYSLPFSKEEINILKKYKLEEPYSTSGFLNLSLFEENLIYLQSFIYSFLKKNNF